jgi:hypothetical protein
VNQHDMTPKILANSRDVCKELSDVFAVILVPRAKGHRQGVNDQHVHWAIINRSQKRVSIFSGVQIQLKRQVAELLLSLCE